MPPDRAPPDDHTLMELRAGVLFTYDARGRMLHDNDPDHPPACRLFLGRTRGGHVLRFGHDIPDDLAEQLTEIVRRHPVEPDDGLRVPPTLSDALHHALVPLGPVESEGGGPAYRFPPRIDHPTIDGEVVQVTSANLEVARYTYPWLLEELAGWAPCFAVLQDGRAVSVCFTSRIGPHAVEAGVDTLPAFRRRGYAAAATAAWGAHIMGEGRIPIYSTGWDNLASQAVAQRLSLILFGTNASWK